jgi:plastocyanin
MRTLYFGILALALAIPAAAGDIHGKVACKGTRDCADAVVYVDAIAGKTFPPPQAHEKINQQNLVFDPHVAAVLVGTTVDFLNSDTVQHNVFSPDACAEKFNLGTWPKGQTRSYTFKKDCVATLLCKVHAEMEAYVVAVPTPYYAVTKADGSFKIADVPDGSYTVKVWHPKLKATAKPVTVAGATETTFEIAR